MRRRLDVCVRLGVLVLAVVEGHVASMFPLLTTDQLDLASPRQSKWPVSGIKFVPPVYQRVSLGSENCLTRGEQAWPARHLHCRGLEKGRICALRIHRC